LISRVVFFEYIILIFQIFCKSIKNNSLLLDEPPAKRARSVVAGGASVEYLKNNVSTPNFAKATGKSGNFLKIPDILSPVERENSPDIIPFSPEEYEQIMTDNCPE